MMDRDRLVQMLSSGQVDGWTILSEYAIENGKKFSQHDYHVLQMVGEMNRVVMSIVEGLKRKFEITEVSLNGRVVKYL